MRITRFNDEAQKRGIAIEAVRSTFENDIDKGLLHALISPDKSEAICFELDEIEGLIPELSSGKISLSNLAEQLNLTIHQLRLVLQHLQKTNRINGELTYSTYITKATLQKTALKKAKEHKRLHRLKMRNK